MLHQNIINTDLVFINDLTINTIIGQEPWERETAQPLVVNVSIATNFSHTVIEHKLIINLIMNLCHTNTFDTLGSLAIHIEQLIISKYSPNITSLEITVKKLFPVTNAKEIGVKIARTYMAR